MKRITEHGFDTAEGLPEPLPAGERLLWQGRPSLRGLLLHALHARKVAVYFAVLSGWQVLSTRADGLPLGQTVAAALWPLLLGALCVGIFALIAYGSHRTTRYVITSRRVVMRIGITLPVTLNLPFAQLDSADMRLRRDGSGDLILTPGRDDRIAWALLWPHARPWHLRHPQPMLRELSDAREAGEILATAMRAVSTRAVADDPSVRAARSQAQGAGAAELPGHAGIAARHTVRTSPLSRAGRGSLTADGHA